MFSTVRKPNDVQATTVAKTGVNDIYEELRNKNLVLPYINDATVARATLATEFEDSDADIVFSAREFGVAGNGITVELKVPDTAGEVTPMTYASLTDEGNVEVKLRCVSPTVLATAQEVIDAINYNSEVSAVLMAALASGSDGTGVVEVMAATNLADGANGYKLTVTALQIFKAVAKAGFVPSDVEYIDLTEGEYIAEGDVIHVIERWAASNLRLPRDAETGHRIIVTNQTASAISVVPISAITINGASSYSLEAGKGVTFLRIENESVINKKRWATI